MKKDTLERGNQLVAQIESQKLRLNRLKKMQEDGSKSSSVSCSLDFVNTSVNDQRVSLGHNLTMKIMPILIEETAEDLDRLVQEFENL